MSRASGVVVACGVRLSEVGLSEIRKPQVISGRLYFRAMRRGLTAKIPPLLPVVARGFQAVSAIVSEGLIVTESSPSNHRSSSERHPNRGNQVARVHSIKPLGFQYSRRTRTENPL
jgi:hypothetical protein